MKYIPIEIDDLVEVDIENNSNIIDETREFAKALKVKMPSAMFSLGHDNCFNVYREGDAFSLGEVWFDEYAANGKRSYKIKSHLIRNERYDHHSTHHFIKSAKNLDTAVNTAIKWLAQPCVGYLASIYTENYMNKLKNQFRDEKGKLMSSYYHLSDMLKPESTELVRLTDAINRNDISTCPYFYTLLKEYTESARSYLQQTKIKISTRIVMLNERKGSTLCEVLYLTRDTEIKDVLKKNAIFDSSKSIERYIDDQIPEDIIGKVSMLSMVEKGTYVEGVGHKINRKLFFIEDRYDTESEEA